MKQLLTLCLLLLTGLCRAQTYTDPVTGLPRDSATARVSFVSVVPVAGAGQAELYRAARQWFTDNFGSGKAVVDIDDPAAGMVVGTGYSLFTQKGSLGVGVVRLGSTVKIYTKEGRYRCEVTNFTTCMDARPYPKVTIEESITSKHMLRGNGTANAYLVQLADEATRSAAAQLASVESAMKASRAASKKDW